MQKSYIILAHKNPGQLKLLIERLADKQSHFYIHVDKNIEIEPFRAFESLANVSFVNPREKGTWGDIGIVKGTLNALRQILKDSRKGTVILLSGQDYPIKTNEQINAYLDENAGCDFIDISPLDKVLNAPEWVEKLQFYKYNISDIRADHVLIPRLLSKYFYTLKTINKLGKVLLFRPGLLSKSSFYSHLVTKRIPYENIPSYAGGQWWALSLETVDKIIDFVDLNPDFIAHHQYTLLPDEIFFQSIIMRLCQNDPTIIFKPSLHYANWSRKNCPLPVTFVSSDLAELKQQPHNMLYARKFDLETDKEIFELLDSI
ncbi:beta-1,6-N-acetylglucosaminyltransferase [Flavobacterium sp. GT3R68]|uniref:beta-1,6-N-acetylglucosaminyltransferase n=1 Tax=Flavobacterium sp. GT3R68 TaxID=2594437 RepID=UPI000F8604D2|nr:beta-1,6-N-acetylglucosaminyltransferase [Flavobacterium sp. GT3R68]RTY92472.1 hypothetical protein EKL32_16845 [Flavobacterium sp. GSN2]TRW94097.1 beta-1,6-N-acetylglucosaminyltransferase [Flavobacterium sp. GT3R68]